jgi:hypothetical protein
MSLMNQDLELAKLNLIEKDLNLVIVNKGKIIFETNKSGISGFLQAIEKLDKNLVGSAVADKIVGVAAAMLCVYSGVTSVFAQIISLEGIRALEDNNIKYLFEKKVSNILNLNKNDVCPFEKLAIAIGNTGDAYVQLKSLVRQMMSKSMKTGC